MAPISSSFAIVLTNYGEVLLVREATTRPTAATTSTDCARVQGTHHAADGLTKFIACIVYTVVAWIHGPTRRNCRRPDVFARVSTGPTLSAVDSARRSSVDIERKRECSFFSAFVYF